MRFIRWCINNPVSVNLLIIMLVVTGMLSLIEIKRELFPSFSLDRVSINIIFPGASSEEI